jgi:hypothetical protein
VPAATLTSAEEASPDTWRKSLMRESDSLLDEVESLRLADEDAAPITLREAIQGLQRRLGRKDPPLPPATLHAAHELVFAVQQRLMAANPNHPRPNRHVGRAGGQPVMARVRDEKLWKLLTLPPPPNGLPDSDWLELVDSTVERAWDRWCYAQQQAVRAARAGNRPQVALAVARIAWSNYWELDQESRAIKKRLSVLPAMRRGGTRAALPA